MLDLYILENCPYCKKVLAFLEEHKIKFTPINIEDKKNEETSILIGLNLILCSSKNARTFLQ